MTLNKIVADVLINRQTDKTRFAWDFRTGIGFSYLQQLTNGTDVKGSGTVLVNGTTMSTSNPIPNGTRCTIEHDLSTGTDDGNIFSDQNGSNQIKGNIYDIKIYNGATLVAHYDMSTGTVQDVSGNGNHATLTGGTWVDDGAGGTGTTYSGAGTSAGISSLTSSEKVIQSASGSTQGNTSLTSNEIKIYSASGTSQGSSSLSSNETVIYGANGSSQGTTILSPGEHLILPAQGTSTGQSSLTSSETVIGHGTTIYSGSGQAQGSSSLSSAESMSYAANGMAQGLSSLLAHEIISLLASGISDGYTSLKLIDASNNTVIAKIYFGKSNVVAVDMITRKVEIQSFFNSVTVEVIRIHTDYEFLWYSQTKPEHKEV